ESQFFNSERRFQVSDLTVIAGTGIVETAQDGGGARGHGIRQSQQSVGDVCWSAADAQRISAELVKTKHLAGKQAAVLATELQRMVPGYVSKRVCCLITCVVLSGGQKRRSAIRTKPSEDLRRLRV